jgi:hypothetical protein
MNCTTCDAPLEPGALFCANCGARVASPAPTSSAAMPTISLPGGPQQASPSDSNEQGGSPYPPQSYLPQPYPPQSYPPTTVPNSNAAVISLVFGILSWVGLVFIGAIVAIIAGHMARNEIRNAGGQIGGSGMATAGLILGYANVVVSVLGCAGFFLLFLIGAAAR